MYLCSVTLYAIIKSQKLKEQGETMPTYNKGKKFLKEMGKDVLRGIYVFLFPAIVVGYCCYALAKYIRYGDEGEPN
jgi:hypothetical protein